MTSYRDLAVFEAMTANGNPDRRSIGNPTVFTSHRGRQPPAVAVLVVRGVRYCSTVRAIVLTRVTGTETTLSQELEDETPPYDPRARPGTSGYDRRGAIRHSVGRPERTGADRERALCRSVSIVERDDPTVRSTSPARLHGRTARSASSPRASADGVRRSLREGRAERDRVLSGEPRRAASRSVVQPNPHLDMSVSGG